MSKPTVFISYSHKDEEWKKRFLPQLKALEQAGRVQVWDDRKIDAGDKWYPEIQEAMQKAAVAVCLISADYLASDFCVKEEVPFLLERGAKEGMVIIPVLLHPCPWNAFPWLSEIQMLPRDGKTVSEDFQGREAGVFAQVAARVLEIVGDPNYKPPPAPPPKWVPPEKVDISRLPVTGVELFGRQKEIERLDADWLNGGTHVVSLVAWGGVGKSTLVNKWLERMAADNYRGARRVYGWSFYSQGTKERVTSGDQFINHALEWFGDPRPTEGSPWDKGERLAGLVRREKALLILDGMEPLQSGHDFERGRIKDPALATLQRELARENQGLCVITTRETVTDLGEFPETTRHEDLEHLSAEAGRALLRVGGVRGTDAELEKAAGEFGFHALALNLLAAYLQDIPGHHISEASRVPDMNIPDEKGRHPRRVIAAFEKRFGEGPEVEVLRMLGLFDRPATGSEIAALREAPAISGLTERVQKLSGAEWLRVLQRLRKARLIAKESKHDPDRLDAHPLVREHFEDYLRGQQPETWREGNSRLYEHLKGTATKFPHTIEEMAPLYAAVAHGCAAGRHGEALAEVYWRRIQREQESFGRDTLGAIGADLAAVSGFFDLPWQQPVRGLSEAAKSFVLNEAGVGLRALGRLAEAVEPCRAGLEADISSRDWKNASRAATNLSELYLVTGDLGRAMEYAQRIVKLADRSGDSGNMMIVRTVLANTLQQAGQPSKAEAAFREAEEMQKRMPSQFRLLYSTRGFYYCDLLLDQREHEEVRQRASETIEIAKKNRWLVDIALDYVSLGRAHVPQTQAEGTGDFAQAERYLNQAVAGLREAGKHEFIVCGLLARAELWQMKREFKRAQADLDEAMRIATRSSMRLYEADCHLECARLHLAQGEKDKAREHWATAKGMIEKLGYHRRDKDVAVIAEQLGEK